MAEEIVLDRYDDVRAALSSKDLTRSLDRELYEVGNISEGTLSTLHGNEHRDRRRVENQLFRRATLESYERVLFPQIVEHTLGTFVSSPVSDLMEIGGMLTVVLAARTAGVDLDADSYEQRQRLREFLHLFAIGTAIDVARGDVEEIKEQMRSALAAFDEEFVRASRARREALLREFYAGPLPEQELPPDVLSTLLRARHEGTLEMDDALLLREVTEFFAAGAHTSTQTLTNSFHLVFAWCREHPQDWDRLATDVYFAQRAVQEALRCRPTNPMIHRRAATDTVVGDQAIAAGTTVLLSTAVANADVAAYGPDAGEYNPHRRCPKDSAPWGMSFGHGIHLCIGRTLAVGLPVGPDDSPPEQDHLYGLVPHALQALVQRGIQPHESDPPVPDTKTERYTRWASYPVRFDGAVAPTLTRA
jgi:cytochrome P450